MPAIFPPYRQNELTPQEFGAVGDGVANDTVALNQWISASMSRKLRALLPRGIYKYLCTASTTGLLINNTVEVCGDAGSEIRFVGDGSFYNFVTVQAADVSIAGITFSDYTITGSTKSLFLSLEGADRLSLFGNRFVGRVASQTPGVHGIQANYLLSSVDVTIINCDFFTVGYGIFTPNAMTVNQTGWRIDACRFYQNLNDDIALNANTVDAGGNPGKWRDTTITGCVFSNNLYNAAGGVPLAGFGVALANVERITVTGNVFSNYTDSRAVHIEDQSKNIIVSGNEMYACKWGVYVLATCDNIRILGNVLKYQDSVSTSDTVNFDTGGFGLHVLDVASAATNVAIEGNTVQNYPNGIGFGKTLRNSGSIINNRVVGCGRSARIYPSMNMAHNVFESCHSALEILSPGILGSMTYINCTNFVTAATTTKFVCSEVISQKDGNLYNAGFNAATEVSTGNDTITITGHGFVSNTPVNYFAGTGAIGGLSDTQRYYVIFVDANTIKLSATAGPGSAIDLTSTGTGTAKLNEEIYLVTTSKVVSRIYGRFDGAILSASDSRYRNGSLTYDGATLTQTNDFTQSAGSMSGLSFTNDATNGLRFNLYRQGVTTGSEAYHAYCKFTGSLVF